MMKNDPSNLPYGVEVDLSLIARVKSNQFPRMRLIQLHEVLRSQNYMIFDNAFY